MGKASNITSFSQIRKLRFSGIEGFFEIAQVLNKRLEYQTYPSKFNIISILCKYNININHGIFQIKISNISNETSGEWLAKLTISKWFTRKLLSNGKGFKYD